MRLTSALFSTSIGIVLSAFPAAGQTVTPAQQTVLNRVWVNPSTRIPLHLGTGAEYQSVYQPLPETPHIGPFSARTYTDMKLGPGGEWRSHTGFRIGYDLNEHQAIEFRDKGLGWTLKF